jgi:non-specific serine/threonine protein kinase
MAARRPREALAEALRAMRAACGMGQEQWAADLQISRKTVQRWERGDSIPDARAQVAIVDLCRDRRAFASALAEVVADEGEFAALLTAARLARHGDDPLADPEPDDLVGRDATLAGTADAVRAHPLVTLTGPAGVGKTRLAIAIAAALDHELPASIVRLGPVADAVQLLPTVAEALQVRQVAHRSLRDAIVARLARPALLVIDNCEHLPDAWPALADLVASCPAVHWLVTSRVALRVPDEHVVVVDALDPEAAATLFQRRALAVAPLLPIGAGQRAVVRTLCDRLDRLPLAIELAAARARVVSPEAMLARIDRGLALLADRRARPDDPHRSLRAALDWSHELLGQPERRVFRRLAVFRGTFGLDDAEAICAGGETDSVDTLEILDALVDHQLVHEAHDTGTTHLGLLETVRDFAGELLAEAGEAVATHRRHAAHYLGLAERLGGELHGPTQIDASAQISLAYSNLLAALEWLLVNDPGRAVVMACSLAPYWDMKSALSEGREWLARGMAAGDGSWVHVATARTWSSYFASLRGDLDDAERLATDALTTWTERGVTAGRGYALLMLGFVSVERGDLTAGADLLQQSLAALEEAGDRWGMVRPLNNLGEVARARGDLERAGQLHARALALIRDLGDLGSQPSILSDLGHVRLLSGEPDAARALAREVIEISELLGNRLGAAAGLELLGLALLDDDPVEAASALDAAEELRLSLGAPAEARDRERIERARHGPAPSSHPL